MAKELSIVVFIDDVPVGYVVTQQNAAVVFAPTEFSHMVCCPPHFTVTSEQGAYHFEPSINQDVKRETSSTLEQL